MDDRARAILLRFDDVDGERVSQGAASIGLRPGPYVRWAVLAYIDEHDLRLALATAGWAVSATTGLSTAGLRYVATARRQGATCRTLRSHHDSAGAVADLATEVRKVPLPPKP